MFGRGAFKFGFFGNYIFWLIDVKILELIFLPDYYFKEIIVIIIKVIICLSIEIKTVLGWEKISGQLIIWKWHYDMEQGVLC